MNEFELLSLFHFIQVFARLAPILVVIPGFGQIAVTPRNRLLIAVAATLLVAPIIPTQLTIEVLDFLKILPILLFEVITGIFIGMVGRILLSMLDFTGNIIGFMSGISSATLFNPTLEDQSHIVSVLLTTAGVALLVALDLHHVMLKALIASYNTINYTSLTYSMTEHFADFVEILIKATTNMFAVGLQLTSPFILIGVILQGAMGLLSRLVPQIQVFFISLPLQILLGWVMLLLLVTTVLIIFQKHFFQEFIN
jgi:flagellar biosynthetic protein FliR